MATLTDKTKYFMRRPALWAIIAGLLASPVAPLASKPLGQHTYGVASFDPYYYYIYEELDGEVQNMDYECVYSINNICTVTSDQAPDLFGRLPRYQASVLSAGTYYVDLNPYQ